MLNASQNYNWQAPSWTTLGMYIISGCKIINETTDSDQTLHAGSSQHLDDLDDFLQSRALKNFA